tara:strand:+ start:114 stop:338 length:225 start_codon:yes stop_codon:yes gene_type:complete
MHPEVSLLEALRKKYIGDIAVHEANILAFEINPVGIGEHSDIVQSLDVEVEKLASAKDKLNAVEILIQNFHIDG